VDNTPLRCVVAGGESLLVECAQQLLDRGHTITTVVSAAPDVARWAAERGLPLVRSVKDLVAAPPAPYDVFFGITNLEIVPPAVLAQPRHAAVNFHDGPLPEHAGMYVTTWALLAREPEHAVTFHLMLDAVDAGDVLVASRFPVDPGDTAFSLNARCYEHAMESFGVVLDRFEAGDFSGTPQPTGPGAYHGRWDRPSGAGALDWHAATADTVALVRALDFGPRYPNPLSLAHVLVGDEAVAVGTAEEAPDLARPGTPPGTVLAADSRALVVATADGAVRLGELRRADGVPVDPSAVATAGARLTDLTAEQRAAISEVHQAIVRHEAWWAKRLEGARVPELPGVRAPGRLALPDPVATTGDPTDSRGEIRGVVTTLVGFLARATGTTDVAVGYAHPDLAAELAPAVALVAPVVPLRVALDHDAPGWRGVVDSAIHEVHRRIGHLADLPQRRPELDPTASLDVRVVVGPPTHAALSGAALVLSVQPAADGRTTIAWHHDPAALPLDAVQALVRQYEAFSPEGYDPDGVLAAVPLLAADELRVVLEDWNATAVDVPGTCLHDLVRAQVARTPDAPALTVGEVTLTYAQLARRARRLAHRLRELGVGPDVTVGLCLERSIDLVVGVLAVHEAGGAYVPLDPAYPADRIAFMISDSKLRVLLTRDELLPGLEPGDATVLALPHDDGTGDGDDIGDPGPVEGTGVQPHHLAYVIYTSGSTGLPKGVMVEHRNAVNFFVGMDAVVRPADGAGPDDQPGTWLAVTSLSFDISVLELLYTFTRGYRVVLHTGDHAGAPGAPDAAASPAVVARGERDISFSLFYFASGEGGPDQYKLLLDGARFADAHGFEAVWTPERHFHRFGGPYPNPSVTSAAIAAVTERVGIRAGSCVLPLHSPIRVAEEWAVVDNLSRGRVGLSVAAGWQPNDFILRPESLGRGKEVMFRDLEVLRRLWRGETVEMTGADGQPQQVATLPRPVQPELPIWVTTAGSPDTYRKAGESGANVLTHLLGQDVDVLAERIALYRQAWREAGHAGEGHVTLMLHTYVGTDQADVDARVREPMKEYLRSSADLIRGFANAFPTFAGTDGKISLDDLDPEDMDALLDFATERYCATSGLFGTPESCRDMVERLRAIEVDEIACLVDFGVETEAAIAGLPRLARLKELGEAGHEPPLPDGAVPLGASGATVPELIRRHGATHLQCTPSLLAMLVADDEGREAVGHLHRMFIGGEAFPVPLARTVTALLPGRVTNMYGPTETTIWSSTHLVDAGVEPAQIEKVPIGKPIANTQLYVLDDRMRAVPVGTVGDLWIGGKGVVRGYHDRAEMTADRFVVDPFRPGQRLYRTGDLARWLPDGTLDFLGRSDFQVKIRGHRIELGEIETVLGSQAGVHEAVVVAREDRPGDVRLVAYYTQPPGAAGLSPVQLEAALESQLPATMVPSTFVLLDAFPLTPNGKVDRKALPAPSATAPVRRTLEPPGSDLERSLAELWEELLGGGSVGVDDNFFDLGGHSLLAVQLQRRVRALTGKPVGLTDVFRYPTIRTLAAHLGDDGEPVGVGAREAADDRGRNRRDAAAARRDLRRRGRD
jgi:natural product biosynthesis luciferase-like monooxygenase protein